MFLNHSNLIINIFNFLNLNSKFFHLNFSFQESLIYYSNLLGAYFIIMIRLHLKNHLIYYISNS
jgi:hypothetical protein